MTFPESGRPPSPADRERAATERKLKIFALLVAILLLAGFLAVHFKKAADEKELAHNTSEETSAAPIVDVVRALNAPASSPLTLPGATAAWYESTIYARVDGYVGSWTADIGDHVKQGQVLATIETPDLDAQLAAAQAKLKSDRALVVARQADADFAKTTYERWKNSPKGVVSEQERDEKKAGYDSAVAQLDEAQAQVGLDQADVDRYTALTQFKQVTAPYDGVITERKIDIGNLVTAGSTANTTPLYRMVQDDPMRVFVDVPQSAANDIKTETAAQIMANDIPNRVFNGKVTRTADAINAQTRTLLVEVDLPNHDHALVPGMYVDAEFQVPAEGLLQVPAAALVFRPSGPVVAVVGDDNRVSFHKVTIARDNGDTVDLSSGVAAGDKIVLNISSQIAEGEEVEAHTLKDGSAHAAKDK